MIDLMDTCIPNIDGKLKDLFLSECKKQNYKPYSDTTTDKDWNYIMINRKESKTNYMGSRYKEGIELTLEDLAPHIWNGEEELKAGMIVDYAGITCKVDFVGRFNSVITETNGYGFKEKCVQTYSLVKIESEEDKLYKKQVKDWKIHLDGMGVEEIAKLLVSSGIKLI